MTSVTLWEEKNLAAFRIICVDVSRIDYAGFSTCGGGSKVLVAEFIPDEILTAGHSGKSRETACADHVVVELSSDAGA